MKLNKKLEKKGGEGGGAGRRRNEIWCFGYISLRSACFSFSFRSLYRYHEDLRTWGLSI